MTDGPGEPGRRVPLSTRRRLSLTPQALTLGLAVFLIHSVWNSTGSRVAISAEAAVVALLVADLLWSLLVSHRVRVSVLDNPDDATVGEPTHCEVAVSGTRSAVELRMVSAAAPRWLRVDSPQKGTLTAVAGARGVATAAVFEARAGGPLGLVGILTQIVVPLPRPLHVAPRLERGPELRQPEGAPEIDDHDEVLRGTRPWTPIDPLRSVHWPSVARTGSLTVRELEHPPRRAVTVAVDLAPTGHADDDQLAERAAGWARWVVEEYLRRGVAVMLATVAGGATEIAAVRSSREVGRRLAAAQRATPSIPAAAGTVWVRAQDP